MKLTQAQYSLLEPYWDVVEQENPFDADVLFARFEDCFVSRLPNNTPVAALFGTRRLTSPETHEPTWWIGGWLTNSAQTPVVQARHVARAMAEGAQFLLPLGYTHAYGFAPKLFGKADTWSRALLASDVVDLVPTAVGRMYRVNIANYLIEMQARS